MIYKTHFFLKFSVWLFCRTRTFWSILTINPLVMHMYVHILYVSMCSCRCVYYIPKKKEWYYHASVCISSVSTYEIVFNFWVFLANGKKNKLQFPDLFCIGCSKKNSRGSIVLETKICSLFSRIKSPKRQSIFPSH